MNVALSPVDFPMTVGVTGGLEQVVGSMLAMERPDHVLLFDAAYCLDAPQSVPAGAHYAYNEQPAQRFSQRGE